MYLLDTNIILEILLDQERADEAALLLREVPGRSFWVSDFSLFSIGIHLFRRGKSGVFDGLVRSLFVEGGARLARLDTGELHRVVSASAEYGLDFDDAYQLSCAERYDLSLISFDAHFDRTGKGRRTPVQVVQGLRLTDK